MGASPPLQPRASVTLDDERALSRLEALWRAYLVQLRLHGLRTKALTSAAVFALADLLSQCLGGAAHFELPRFLLVAAWGLAWGGPSAHYWQAFMERISSRRDIRAILIKVAFDQLTYGPLNNLLNVAFFTLTVENQGMRHLVRKLARDFPRLQRDGWRVWPAAALFNYRYVPLHLRVLFLNVVALAWTTFLNYSATRHLKHS